MFYFLPTENNFNQETFLIERKEKCSQKNTALSLLVKVLELMSITYLAISLYFCSDQCGWAPGNLDQLNEARNSVLTFRNNQLDTAQVGFFSCQKIIPCIFQLLKESYLSNLDQCHCDGHFLVTLSILNMLKHHPFSHYVDPITIASIQLDCCKKQK